jgi:hypothetical protein
MKMFRISRGGEEPMVDLHHAYQIQPAMSSIKPGHEQAESGKTNGQDIALAALLFRATSGTRTQDPSFTKADQVNSVIVR